LPHSEIKATAKSIATWTWRKITPQGLRELIEHTHTPEQQRARGRKATNQAEAGKASGEARKAARDDLRATARLMRAQGMTQQAIADALGVPRETVRNWLA
jgi:DNA invertase Pin-like site-specific DNA recombinase